MLRSIPPVTALGRRTNIPDRRFRMIGLGMGSGQPRTSSLTPHDKWNVAEHKTPIMKHKPKIVIRPENGKIGIEIHDNGDHYQVISNNGKPAGLGIENIIRALSPFGIAQEMLNNSMWSAIIRK